MIVEKRPILLVLALRFLCALCSNDAPTSRGTTIAMSTGLDYDSGSTENLGIYDPRSTENNVEITSHGAITTYHESTVEPLMTVFQLVTDNDKSSSPTTVDRTTRLVTMPDDVIFTTNTTCDPTWPVNASGN